MTGPIPEWLLSLLAAATLFSVMSSVGLRLAAAVAMTTAGALVAGHVLGGPDPRTRTAVATTAAMRNAGLALLVSTLNAGPPAIRATVLAYIASSVPIVLAYLAWRRRVRAPAAPRV